MRGTYHLKKIRVLLSEGFSEAELRRLCFEETDFKPVYHQLSDRSSQAEIIDVLLEFAEQKSLLESLLTWAGEYNPARYEQYQPYKEVTAHTPQHNSNPAKWAEGSLEIEPPQGTMRSDSKFYIDRAADKECWKYLTGSYAVTLFVQAPRQMGKSSLMRRMIDRAERELKKKTAFIDFQEFPKQYFNDTSEEIFLIELCLMIGRTLGVDEAIDWYWQGRGTNIVKCGLYLAKHVIPALNEPFILAMDEVDRLLPSPFRDNFLGMLRVWHNKRAFDESFRKMSLFLSSSTEASLLIANHDQSPFNVADRIVLEDFTRAEVAELNRRHKSPLNQSQMDDLMALIGGHPYLTRVALYQVVTGKVSVAELLTKATEDSGPFGDHLQYQLLLISERPELKQVLTQLYHTRTMEENHAFHYLKGIGLIKKVGSQIVFRNHLCELYFKNYLKRRLQ